MRTTSVPKLQPRQQLPDITEPPKSAWLAGLAAGFAMGCCTGAGLLVLFLCKTACR